MRPERLRVPPDQDPRGALDQDPRDETEAERNDRNLAELLQELRISGTVATGLPAWLITVCVALLFGGLWFAFPLARRH
jgi:hypothetical protein